MNRPKSPQPPAGNAAASETRRKSRPDKPSESIQPASSQTNEPASGPTNESGSTEISTEKRRRMIEEAAYYCAQRRQMTGEAGTSADDWAEAEAQIERLLQEQRNKKQD